MAIRLKTAEQHHAPRIVEIIRSSTQAHLSFLPSLYSIEEDLNWVRTVLLPGHVVVLAEHNDYPVGVVAISQIEGKSCINQLYIAPEHTRKGFGTFLLQYALKNLPRPIQILTFAENYGARRFYERNEFIPIKFSDGSANDAKLPDVLYELS